MRRENGRKGDRTYSGKVELGCNGGWLGRLPRLLEGVKIVVRRGKGQDERPTGWVEKGTRLILKRGHVSRSQSNTLAEGREPGSGRPFAFGLDNRAVLRAQDLEIYRMLGCDREKRNFVVRYPPV